MHPVICKVGPFTVYAYGLMLAVAFIVSSLLVSQAARRYHINTKIIFDFAFLVFISGIIGARLFYVIENIAYYIKNPLEIINLSQGGLSWFGGLALAIISGIVYLRKKKLSVYKTFDLIAPFVALGQAIGRIGCLLNGCCFGNVLGIIPTQIFSSLVLVIIFVILRLLQDRPYKEGQIFFTYLLLYSLKRFFIEFWRQDTEIIFLKLTLFQLISILIFCLSFIKLIFIKRTTS